MATKKKTSTKSRKPAASVKPELQVVLNRRDIDELLYQLQGAMGHVIDMRLPYTRRHELRASPFELALTLLREAHYKIERSVRLSTEVQP